MNVVSVCAALYVSRTLQPFLRSRCWDGAKFLEALLLAIGAECKLVQVRVFRHAVVP